MSEQRLVRATELAWRWHGEQTRKGKTTPYMSHLLQVQALVLEHGGDADQAVAALLHDALEDAESPRERTAREGIVADDFGPRVLRIVLDCTDTHPAEAGALKGPWQTRKDRYVVQLRGAEPDSLLVAACDKRHNLGDLIVDLRDEGIGTFERFNAGPREQLWYFSTLEELFRPRIPRRLASDLGALVAELSDFVRSADGA